MCLSLFSVQYCRYLLHFQHWSGSNRYSYLMNCFGTYQPSISILNEHIWMQGSIKALGICYLQYSCFPEKWGNPFIINILQCHDTALQTCCVCLSWCWTWPSSARRRLSKHAYWCSNSVLLHLSSCFCLYYHFFFLISISMVNLFSSAPWLSPVPFRSPVFIAHHPAQLG